MGRASVRGILGLVLLCMFAILVPATSAEASSDTSFISFTSDPEDWVGQGDARTLTGTDGVLLLTMADASTFTALFRGYDGITNASLDLRAPSGQPLVTGVYENATRFQSGDPSLPQLDFSYAHRGCNTINGRFQVLEAIYGPYNYIQSLDATFEQHCEGSTAASYGEVRVINPPPPPVQVLQASVDPVAAVAKDGSATVGGTVTCSLPLGWPDVTTVIGSISQKTGNGVATSEISTFAAPCTPDSDPWSYPVRGMKVGKAVVTLTARAPEPNYPGEFATVTISAVVHLQRR